MSRPGPLRLALFFVCACVDARCAEPAKQFQLVQEHIEAIRRELGRKGCRVFVYVERNLGFEAEHHRRALGHLPGVSFYVDQGANRVGVLTTEQVKHAMCQLVVAMLKEHRLHIKEPLISKTPQECRIRLREQMEIYGYQVKLAANTFQKERIALSGKIGGMKDDVCICLQLACYFTQIEGQRAADLFRSKE